ncbi:MAG: cell wall-binding repeat-containing protein, partial [Candidatus Hydrothermarchaeales archaeon]
TKVLNIPLLLVEPDAVPTATSDAMQKLGATSAIIVGGPEAVAEELVPSLPNSTRIWGVDRYWTATRLAEALMEEIKVDTVVVTDGLEPEGTTVMVASFYDAPIIYVKGDEVPEATRKFLSGNKFKKVILVGVSDAAAGEVKGIVG